LGSSRILILQYQSLISKFYEKSKTTTQNQLEILGIIDEMASKRFQTSEMPLMSRLLTI
jgi:hypothetical protein